MSKEEMSNLVDLVKLRLDAPEFLQRVRKQQGQGYTLTAVLVDGAPVAAAGWRRQDTLFSGFQFYIDDLITAEDQRGRGYGKALLDHLAAQAKREGAGSLQLDSGTQRKDAHRFYLRERFDITSFHFGRQL
jgi:GNAT superfamily N-acetyltransferase